MLLKDFLEGFKKDALKKEDAKKQEVVNPEESVEVGPIITIAREFGSGGREIAMKVSQKLKFDFYDKEKIIETAKKNLIAAKDELIALAKAGSAEAMYEAALVLLTSQYVVRDEKLNTAMPWDTTNARTGNNNSYCSLPEHGCNVWGNQTNTLYNNSSLGNNFHYSYYTSSDASNLTNGQAGKIEEESSLNKYLNNNWLNSTNLSDIIDNHKFNANGVYYSSSYTNGDKGLEKEKC